MAANSVHFAPVAVAQGKYLLLGPRTSLLSRICDSARSLQETEFVAIDELLQREVDRRSVAGQAIGRARGSGAPVPDTIVLGTLRHWFWSRPAQKGFFLAGVPGNAGQASVIDLWLEERGIALDAVLGLEPAIAGADHRETTLLQGVYRHYEGQGLLVRVPSAAADEDEAISLAFEQLAQRTADR